MGKKTNEKFSLCIYTISGNRLIPFTNLGALDTFTSQYDKAGLVLSLSKKLNDNNLKYKIKGYNICYDYDEEVDEDIYHRQIMLPVMLNDDNYDYEDLKYKFTKYIKRDPKRIKKFSMRFIKNDRLQNYLSGNTPITDNTIEHVCDLFFKTNGYMVIREVYFALRQDMVKIKKRSGEMGGRLKEASSDDYYDYLISYAKRGPKEYEEAMDILGMEDLEELSIKLHHQDRGIVDGLSTNNQNDIIDNLSLDELSKLSEEDLVNIVLGMTSSNKKRK